MKSIMKNILIVIFSLFTITLFGQRPQQLDPVEESTGEKVFILGDSTAYDEFRVDTSYCSGGDLTIEFESVKSLSNYLLLLPNGCASNDTIFAGNTDTDSIYFGADLFTKADTIKLYYGSTLLGNESVIPEDTNNDSIYFGPTLITRLDTAKLYYGNTLLSSGDTVVVIDDTNYGITWDGNMDGATKNAIYDQLQLIIGGAADGVATAGVHDIVNDELDITVTGGSNFSIDISQLVRDSILWDSTAAIRSDFPINTISGDPDYLSLNGDDIVRDSINLTDHVTGQLADVSVAESNVTQHEGAINHDNLTGFVANEHVDHSSVSVITGATSGLSGGGDLTTNRTIVVDPSLATSGTVAALDEVLIADVDASDSLRKVTAQSIANLAEAESLPMARIGASTFYTVQHMQDIFHSSGQSSGGVISDAGGQTVDVTAGTGFIRKTDDQLDTIFYFDWSASLGNSIDSNTINYVGVEYNAGSPQVIIKTVDTWDLNMEFPLGTVVDENAVLHIVNAPHAVGDHAGQMIDRMYETQSIVRDARSGGLILNETGDRSITVSAGGLWHKLQRFTISAINTSTSDTFDRYYRDGSGGWTTQSGQTRWDSIQYDDGSGTLAAMSNNWYAVQYFYLDLNGSLISLYGWNEYSSLSAALDDPVPSSVPNRISEQGLIIGRIVYQDGAGVASSIDSYFETALSSGGVTSHGDLSGLADDDHTQYSLLVGRSGGQTLIGGTASSNDLTLRSTSNATKGNVLIEGARLADADDATKQIILNLSGVTTATSRTWVMPDYDVTPDSIRINAANIAAINTDLVNDLTPQLGGPLDVNGQSIGDGTNELITFIEDGSAVNNLEAENEATGSGPILRSTGDDAAVELNLDTKGTADVNVLDNLDVSGNIVLSGSVDGRDIAADGTKLDGVEALADVTDEENVKASLDGATISTATVAGADKVLIQDTDNGDSLRTVTATSIASLSTTLYTGDGSLSGSRVVTTTGYDLDITNATDSALVLQINGTNSLTDDGSGFQLAVNNVDSNEATITAIAIQSTNDAEETVNSGVISGKLGLNDDGVEQSEINFEVLDKGTPEVKVRIDYQGLKHVGVFLTGDTLAAGDLCYFKSDSKMWKVDADTLTTTRGFLAIALEASTAEDELIEFLIQGTYTTSGLTAASEYYASQTEGTWTATAPSDTDSVIRFIGYALSTTELYFDPDQTWFVN